VKVLASNAGKVLSREKILNSIWGYEYPIETRVIDVHIRNLRRKIEPQPARPHSL
jgi:DNA-binding response OmpR family regulator